MVRRRSREGGRGRSLSLSLGWPACCLGFLLKLLAFLQAFAAVSALLYAAWMLSRWARHHQLHPSDLLSPDLWFPSLVMAAGLFYCLLLLAGYLAAEINTGCCLCFVRLQYYIHFLLFSFLGYLFIYITFGFGNSPRQYTIPAMAMMLLEAALAAHLALNQHWIQVPFIQFLFLFLTNLNFFSFLLAHSVYVL